MRILPTIPDAIPKANASPALLSPAMTNARRRRVGAPLAIVVLAALITAGRSVVDASARRRADDPASPSVSASSTSAYVAVGPIRLADTREASCGCTRLDEHTIRVDIAARVGSGLDADIVGAAVTVTVVQGSAAGYATVFPAGRDVPATSTVNARAGAVASNSTIVQVGVDGAVDVYASALADIILDVSGAFVAADGATVGRYQPLAATRLLDTRAGDAAPLEAGGTVTVPMPTDVPKDAVAVAVNVTSVGAAGAGFVVGYAAGATPVSYTHLTLPTNREV